MFTLRKLIFYLSLLLVTFPSIAVEEIPEINFEKFTLANGLRVIVHEDHKLPVVAVNVWYHVGSKDEEMGKTGFAHLFEHLMFNGTEHYNNEYFGPFQKVGATNMNGTTNNDRTNYFENVPTTALELALWMESDRMGHLLGVVNQEKLDEQRGVVQNEKRQGENRPYGRVFLQAAKSTFPTGHPYSWTTIGSMDDLNAATLDDVRKWFNTYYGPNNAVIVLAGDINLETAKVLATKYFGDIPAGPTPLKKKRWIAKRTGQKREIMYDRVPNTRIHKVWNTPELGSLEGVHLDLIATLLAGGKNSYLYQKLVYQERLATNVNAFNYGREIAGQFWITADLAKGRSLEELEAAIDKVVQDFTKRGPSKKLLGNTKTSIQASWIKGIQRVGGFGGKSDILASGEVYVGDPKEYKQYIQSTLDSSAADLKRTAHKWLLDGEYVLTVAPIDASSTVETKADRTQLPFPTEFPKLNLPDIQRARLSNGLEVVLAERHDVPMINFSLQMKNGHAVDPDDQPGLASVTMSMLTEGTKSYDALKLSERLEELGTDLYASTELDVSNINLSTLKSNLKPSLQVFREVIMEPVFDQDEIDRKKLRWLARIDQSLSDPNGIVGYVLPEIIFGQGHPYAKPSGGSGTRESVQWMSRDDMIKYHQRFVNPSNATLLVVGDTTLDEIIKDLDDVLGNWKDHASFENINLDYAIHNVSKPGKVYLVDKPGAFQSLIVAGQLMPGVGSEDEFKITLMNAVIGGDFTSRLNMNLREDKSWSYGVRSRISANIGPSPMLVFAPVQSDQTIPSIQEIIKEYEEYLGARSAEQAELESVVNKRSLGLIGRFETFGELMSGVAEIITFNRDDNYLETLAEEYRSIKLNDIHSAAQQYLTPKDWVWIIVGDLSLIQEGIEDLNIGEIEVLELD